MKFSLANKNKYKFRKGQNKLFFGKKLERGFFLRYAKLAIP